VVVAAGPGPAVVAGAAAAGVEEEMTMKITKITRFFAALPLVLLLTLGAPVPAAANQVFATPEAAMDAFAAALQNQDEPAKRALFGPDYKTWIPPVGDQTRYQFWAAWARSHTIRMEGDSKAWIAVGDKGWTWPIPLAKTAAGWRFDTKAGEAELSIRRIGRNELAAIEVARTYVEAQREYADRDPDGDGVRAYAQKITSSPGRKDGLYWPTARGEAESPLGPLMARAALEGKNRQPGSYQGYRYRILTAQGPSAAGGAASYIASGKMTGGFALIAWPAEYGRSGVMTFIVSQQGVVYQRDLGAATASRAAAIKAFDPDSTWQAVNNP
jgi:hypothetical protein